MLIFINEHHLNEGGATCYAAVALGAFWRIIN